MRLMLVGALVALNWTTQHHFLCEHYASVSSASPPLLDEEVNQICCEPLPGSTTFFSLRPVTLDDVTRALKKCTSSGCDADEISSSSNLRVRSSHPNKINRVIRYSNNIMAEYKSASSISRPLRAITAFLAESFGASARLLRMSSEPNLVTKKDPRWTLYLYRRRQDLKNFHFLPLPSKQLMILSRYLCAICRIGIFCGKELERRARTGSGWIAARLVRTAAASAPAAQQPQHSSSAAASAPSAQQHQHRSSSAASAQPQPNNNSQPLASIEISSAEIAFFSFSLVEHGAYRLDGPCAQWFSIIGATVARRKGRTNTASRRTGLRAVFGPFE
ncbi:unnamed protein product [Trichogramma brassicae]|uniref:Uncharacterized protein n=1 Tax=Trichogramma brassicae TaxID=86971 RepID=A0A6H5IXZ8_9HYME|nr:unnamed protein product [Trichogramma brassicae]